MSKRKDLMTVWTLPALAVTTTIVLACGYANGLNAAFVFDDDPSIIANSSIRRLWPLTDVLWTQAEGGRPHDGRPLLNLSLALNYASHGLWRPGYRLVNLVIHLVNALLLADVIRRLLLVSGQRLVAPPPVVAAAASLLWLAHPLHTHVITYTIQRAESLAAFWIVAAFDLAIMALAGGSLPAAVTAGLAAAAGGLAKETTVSILPLVLAADWAFRGRWQQGPTMPRLRLVLYGGLAANLLVLAAVSYGLGGRGGSAGLATASVYHYLLTQARGIWIYLGRLVWPATLVLDHGDGLVTSFSAVWLAAGAAAAALVVGAVGFFTAPRWWFPFAAFVLLLAPSSSLVPVATQTLAEHRMYLPSACLIGWAVVSVAGLARPRSRPLLVVIVAVLVATATGRTVVRNRDYASAVSLWRQNLRDCPDNDRARTNLVAALIRNDDFTAAKPLAAEALRSRPDRDRNWINQGRVLAADGYTDQAIAAFGHAALLAPASVEPLINRGIVLSRVGRFEEAAADLTAAVGRRPDLARGWLALGLLQLRAGRADLAVPALTRGLMLEPENEAGVTNLRLALRQQTEGQEAL